MRGSGIAPRTGMRGSLVAATVLLLGLASPHTAALAAPSAASVARRAAPAPSHVSRPVPRADKPAPVPHAALRASHERLVANLDDRDAMVALHRTFKATLEVPIASTAWTGAVAGSLAAVLGTDGLRGDVSPPTRMLAAELTSQKYWFLPKALEKIDRGSPRPHTAVLQEAAEECLAELRSSPFAVTAMGGKRRWLLEASILLETASRLAPDATGRTELTARADALVAEDVADAASPAAAPLASRDRRLLETVESLRARGWTVDIERAAPEDGSSVQFREDTRRVTVRFTRQGNLVVRSSADEMLRHELQHLHDFARGRLGALDGEQRSETVARREIRANFAATRDGAKAVATTDAYYGPMMGPYIRRLREDVRKERLASEGPTDDGSIDAEVFRRAVRWRGWTPQETIPLHDPVVR